MNTQPCVVCAKMLINAGIEEIVYQNPYPDELAMSMLEEAGMKLRVFEAARRIRPTSGMRRDLLARPPSGWRKETGTVSGPERDGLFTEIN